MIISVLAGMALSTSVMTLIITLQRFDDLSDKYAIAERESRVLEERLSDMKVELVKRGIPLSDH